jgi:hypothetical protein
LLIAAAEARIVPAAARDSVMLDLIRLCLSRTTLCRRGRNARQAGAVGVVRAAGAHHAGTHPRRTIEMPLPQVNDRLKEVPAQALRTIFASIGQLLLVADRFRARAAGQLSGSGGVTAARPSDQAPAAAPPARPAAPAAPPAPDAGDARWRTLDKTGNVRLLDGEQEQEDLAVPGPASQVTAEPVSAPAEYTPTEVVPAVSLPAEPAAPEAPLAGTAATSPADPTSDVPTPGGLTADGPVPADVTADEPAPAGVPAPTDLTPDAPAPADVPAPADLSPDAPAPAGAGLTPAGAAEPAPARLTSAEPANPAPADLTPAESAVSPAPAGETLPVPNYDHLTVASLRARLRVLDTTQVQVLLDYEKAHEGRPAVVTMFERRLTKLSEGS